MPAPTYAVGQVLTANDCNVWFTPLAAYKTSDTGRTTVTLTADPDLTIPVAANAFYKVDAQLFYKISSTAGTDFSWSFTTPAGSGNGLYHALYLGSGGSTAVIAQTNGWTDTGNLADATVVGTVYGVSIHGILATGGTAGSLTVTWAASSATPTTTLTSRSHMVLLRIG